MKCAESLLICSGANKASDGVGHKLIWSELFCLKYEARTSFCTSGTSVLQLVLSLHTVECCVYAQRVLNYASAHSLSYQLPSNTHTKNIYLHLRYFNITQRIWLPSFYYIIFACNLFTFRIH